MTTPTPPSDPTPTPTPPAGPPAPATPTTTSGDQPPAGGTPPTSEPKKIELTQDKLDEIIRDRLAKAQTAFDAKLAEVQATAGKTELEAAQIKAQQAEEKASTVTKASAQRIASTEAKLAAHLAGARPDRLDAVLKQADLTKAVSEDGDVDEAAVKTAIEAVLADYPEWKGTPVPGSSGGELNPTAGGKPTYTREQIAAEAKAANSLPPSERAKKLAELNAAMAEGRVKG